MMFEFECEEPLFLFSNLNNKGIVSNSPLFVCGYRRDASSFFYNISDADVSCVPVRRYIKQVGFRIGSVWTLTEHKNFSNHLTDRSWIVEHHRLIHKQRHNSTSGRRWIFKFARIHKSLCLSQKTEAIIHHDIAKCQASRQHTEE